MQTSETGSDTGSTVTLQTSVAGQAAVPTQVVQQLPVQQQVGAFQPWIKKDEQEDIFVQRKPTISTPPPPNFTMLLSDYIAVKAKSEMREAVN